MLKVPVGIGLAPPAAGKACGQAKSGIPSSKLLSNVSVAANGALVIWVNPLRAMGLKYIP